MKITKYTLITAMVLLTPQAIAGDMYKCSNNGVVAYQHTPCADSSEQTVLVEKKLSKSEIDASEIIKEGVVLSPLLIKKEDRDTESEYQHFAYQATAMNNTETEQVVSASYKGVDSAGFEVKSIYLRGSVKAHSSKILTDTSIMKASDFDRIQQWVLD